MGAAEETSKAIQSTVEVLKSTPAILAILLFNLIFIALIAWEGNRQGERWERVLNTILQQCTAGDKA